MSAHTPGPWFTAFDLWGCVTTRPDGHGTIVAEVRSMPPPELRANAALIAAAPDMLKALQELVQTTIPTGPSEGEGDRVLADVSRGALCAAAAAIAKAEGR